MRKPSRDEPVKTPGFIALVSVLKSDSVIFLPGLINPSFVACCLALKDKSKNPGRAGDKNFMADRFDGLSKLPKLL